MRHFQFQFLFYLFCSFALVIHQHLKLKLKLRLHYIPFCTNVIRCISFHCFFFSVCYFICFMSISSLFPMSHKIHISIQLPTTDVEFPWYSRHLLFMRTFQSGNMYIFVTVLTSMSPFHSINGSWFFNKLTCITSSGSWDQGFHDKHFCNSETWCWRREINAGR